MKLKRFLRAPRLSILAALTAALAAVGLMSFAAPAGADFTLSSGLLLFKNGGTGNPPAGSWVLLINRNTGALFLNFSNNPASLGYTPILGSAAGVGLELGAAQPNGGIFGPLTLFDGALFSAFTLTGSSPSLTFSGAINGTGSRALLAGNLLGLDIAYGGQTYNIGSQFNPFTDGVLPLRGLADGNLLTKTGNVTLHWNTAILLAPFNEYNALFHLVASYDLP
jgi:hypothetical protein